MTSQEYLINFAKKAEGPAGQNLFSHVSTLIEEVTNEKNQLRGVNDIQLLSNHIKNTHFIYNQPILDTELKNLKHKQGLYLNYSVKVNEIVETANKAKLHGVVLPNAAADYEALKLAGISIGQANYHLIHNILKGMATQNITQLKFWGKILGLKDYYVIQGVTKNKVRDEISGNSEPEGEGINYYTYWVTNDLLSDWIELPWINPQHIRGAKQIKYIFTGNLDNLVNKYPTFNGKQKHLLKAQIVRITHNCEITPKGLYKQNDQKPEIIEFDPQFKLPETAQLLAPQSWVHVNQYVNTQGRCSIYIDPRLNEQQKTKAQEQLQNETVARLKSIAEDTPLETLGMTTTWTAQQVGQTQIISPLSQSGVSKSYSAVVLKNLNWPGAFTVGHSKGWVNIYLGYGQKLLQSSFNPVSPKDISVQGVDTQEYPQPYPLQAPPPPVVQNQEKPQEGNQQNNEEDPAEET